MEIFARIPIRGIDAEEIRENHLLMGPDLIDKRWIIAKGILFALLALLAGVLQLLAEFPLWQETALLLVCVWASCRFYYFLFHCLQAYLDPDLKSAGVLDLMGKLWRKNKRLPE